MDLSSLERELGVAYPAAFHTSVGELVALAATAAFGRAFPATRLLFDAGEIRAARKRSESGLLPFMVSEGEHPDIYAFERTAGQEVRVVVWSVHTTVYEWADFPGFVAWARKLCDTGAP